MATIKISRAKNCSAALDYGKGKNQFKEKDRQWLKDHGVNDEVANNIHDRAVVSNGLNVIDGYEKPEMKQSRDLLKNSGSTEAMRFIQSFGDNELDASNPKDLEKANQMGLELAQKIAPDNQISVYTHIDGNGHKLHNHLVMNMPDLKTGKKYNHDNDWQRVTKLSDEIIKSHGLKPLDPTKTKQPEKKSMAERQLQVKGKYVWKDDLRSKIDKAMQDPKITTKNQLSAVLKDKGIIYHERGKNSVSFHFKDENNKNRKIRGINLGNDYTKEMIEHGLESKRTRASAERTELHSEVIKGNNRDQREFNESRRNDRLRERGAQDPVSRTRQRERVSEKQSEKFETRKSNFHKAFQQFDSRLNSVVQRFIQLRLRRHRENLKNNCSKARAVAFTKELRAKNQMQDKGKSKLGKSTSALDFLQQLTAENKRAKNNFNQFIKENRKSDFGK